MRHYSMRAALLAGAMLLAHGSAHAQQGRDALLSERVERLESALQKLEGSVYGNNAAARPPVDYNGASLGSNLPSSGAAASASFPASNPADLAVRITSIEESLQQLTGQVEQLTFRLGRVQSRLDSLDPTLAPTGDEGGMPSFPGGSPFPLAEDAPVSSSEGQGPQTSPNGGPTDLMGGTDMSAPAITVDLPDESAAAYDVAYQAVLAADYDRAEAALEAFVEKFPASPETPDAKLLLGEIYLATGANGDAARVFLDHVSSYENDPRAADAYLKLGMAFARLDRTADACQIFSVGEEKFPNLSPRLAERYNDEQAAAGCR